MKKYTHIKNIDIPIFEHRLKIILSNDKSKVKDIIPFFGDYDLFAHCVNGETEKRSDIVIIILNFDAVVNICHGVVAHECYHAARAVCKNRGVDDEETTAYLIQYFTNEVLGFAKKHDKKCK